jgi:hypothetical protein
MANVDQLSFKADKKSQNYLRACQNYEVLRRQSSTSRLNSLTNELNFRLNLDSNKLNGVEEIRIIEQHISEYQIYVLSAKTFDMLYIGAEKEKKLFFY